MWNQLAKEFEDGDILYGLDGPRSRAKSAILSERSHIRTQTASFIFFTKTRLFERIIIQNQITNAVFSPLQDGLSTDRQVRRNARREDVHIESDPQRAIQFRDFLSQHPKYDVSGYRKTGNMDAARAAWLKTSKAGLEFQATQRDGKIHFILDDLTFDRVLKQDMLPSAKAAARIKYPLDITSGEVRWLFRNRTNKKVVEAVVFWLRGQKVSAPWLMLEYRNQFQNFLYTRDQELRDDKESEFKQAIRELNAALLVQRSFRKRKGKHYVAPGDTLLSIAQNHGLSLVQLYEWNAESISDGIKIGDVLQISRPAD
tara:strand:+ start:680 stop:1621 length:942 start_codon:yes stop_codon:yes gene_type:complete